MDDAVTWEEHLKHTYDYLPEEIEDFDKDENPEVRGMYEVRLKVIGVSGRVTEVWGRVTEVRNRDEVTVKITEVGAGSHRSGSYMYGSPR